MDTIHEKILVVEDDTALRDALVSVLEHEGFVVVPAASAEDALRELAKTTYSCILSDFKLPVKNGIELLEVVRDQFPSLPFVIMTAYASVEIAVAALKKGANDFITKPFNPQHLSEMLLQVIRHRRILERRIGVRSRKERRLVGKSPQMDRLLKDARKVARVDSSVLILGESGTGKELFARYIHEHSTRKDAPFVAINCGAIPAELLESEFFGHEAGAFTGATQSRVGVFEVASEGTIFLDEVAEMPMTLQVKLLRAIQEQEIKRVGGNEHIAVHPRIIAATNRDIEAAMNEGNFRDDFYYRLAVIPFTMPPLRERQEDLAELIDYFVEAFCTDNKRAPITLSPGARAILKAYPWPGNIRELENIIERAVILAGECILPEHLGLSLSPVFTALEETKLSLTEIAAHAAAQAEREVLREILRKTDGNKSKAAELLGVSYKTILNKVREHHLEADVLDSRDAL